MSTTHTRPSGDTQPFIDQRLDAIDRALLGKDDAGALHILREEVASFCGKFPMPH